MDLPRVPFEAFDEEGLTLSLERLGNRARVAFAAACTERLRSAYLAFAARAATAARAHEYEWLLDRLWADIAGQRAPDEAIGDLVEKATALIPDVEDHDYDPYAEDACAALSYAWECRATGESREAAWAARRVYEAVDQFVIRRDGVDVGEPGAEKRILEHPLVQAELERQADDLRDLGADDDVAVARVRARASQARPFGE